MAGNWQLNNWNYFFTDEPMSQEGIMTRETKIGLLVGLSFIIVVGILLSDHIADSNRPPQALLSDVGNNVRDSVAIPQPSAAQPFSANTPAASSNVTVAGPTAPVPTQEELKQPVAPTPANTNPAPAQADNVVVNVGPGQNAQPLTLPTPANANATPGGTTMPLIADDQANSTANSADNSSAGVTPIAIHDAAPANATAEDSAKVLKQYTVARGDTLGKLAHRFYGTSSHAAVAAILAANPQLKGNAARLAVGKTYVIPVFEGKSASSAKTSIADSKTNAGVLKSDVAMVDTNSMAVKPTTRPSSSALASKTKTRSAAGTYTVKSGDTLSKIAARELGSRRDWKEIEELNPGALHHGQLKVGTVLKLPAKTVASAD